ncbi:hypothetical protein [Lentilactobacillus sp. SPB1-3]|uniref:Uncharacterized protein n=1 Tax=Lentilactobacillus terminaliae TaxID=3003483 RepID=A0ACD5DD93_9LACO|nr:hypothetical protein [Lentilactobacillus sp. SPB1-3]MCZ0978086.1 hypothetical protein [Lentilactobacillus sp. SPB1-3]
MFEQQIIERIGRNPDFNKLDAAYVSDAVDEAVTIIKRYQLSDDLLSRATYLYACNLLFRDYKKSSIKFKTVKLEDGEYTKFDDANKNNYWQDFLDFLSEHGYTNKVTGFS